MKGTTIKRKMSDKIKGVPIRATRKMRGGRKLIDKITLDFERQYTSPDIKIHYQILKGPTTYNSANRFEYLINFLRTTANDFEEELAQTIRGRPKMTRQNKIYKIKHYENDAPMEPGSSNLLPSHKVK